MRSRAPLLLLALLGACSHATRYGPEATPAWQAKAAYDGYRGFRMGHVDRRLQPVSGKATAASPYSTVELTYRGLKDGKLCFSFPYVAQYFRSRGTPEDAIAERVRAARGAVMTFALRLTLDDGRDWPATPPRSQITTAELIGSNLEQRRQERDSGTSTTTEWLTTTIQVCTPAPHVGADTKYLTAASYPSSGTRPPALFVWAVE